MFEPIDWSALPRLRGAEVRAARALRSRVTVEATRAIGATLTSLLRLPVEIDEIACDEFACDEFAGVAIEVATAGGRTRVDLERGLTLAIVGALLGERGSPVFFSANTIDPAIVGALEALVEHVARRHVDRGARVTRAHASASIGGASIAFSIDPRRRNVRLRARRRRSRGAT
ncbi:MAG: hypothetical protein ACHREM_15755, partial [Polyangiales bacterium]